MEMKTNASMKMDMQSISNRDHPHPLHRWLHRVGVLPGALGKLAVVQAVKDYERVAVKLNMESETVSRDVEDVVLYDDEAPHAHFPYIFTKLSLAKEVEAGRASNSSSSSSSSYPIRLGYRVQIAAILEQLCAELFEAIGMGKESEKREKKALMPWEVLAAVWADEELRRLTAHIGLAKQFGLVNECADEDKAEAQRIADATKKNQAVMTDDELIRMFPKTHGMMTRLVNKYAWWSKRMWSRLSRLTSLLVHCCQVTPTTLVSIMSIPLLTLVRL